MMLKLRIPPTFLNHHRQCAIRYTNIDATIKTSANLRCNHKLPEGKVNILNSDYVIDNQTSITPHILTYLNKNLHIKKHHPLCHLRRRIEDYMYKTYIGNRGNPLFSVHNNLSPVVSVSQNFDSLLIPSDHVSRKKSDNYYINSNYILRAHTSAHQTDLIKMGLNKFLVFGDVYRRDEIDQSHYPVFHQADCVGLYTHNDIFKSIENSESVSLFEDGSRNKDNQGIHSNVALEFVKRDLKNCLEGLALKLFGKEIEIRWVDAYFPFTHPSWEMEVFLNGKWVEILGCGIIEQQILYNAGAGDKVGWAFGLGLERWAMALYNIPDIRIFWSKDNGVAQQFLFDDPHTDVTLKMISKFEPRTYDISFWLPKEGEVFNSTDFYDLARTICGDVVEHISLFDEFTHPKTGRTSHSYRIIYRHVHHDISHSEVAVIHKELEDKTIELYNVTMR